MRQKQAPRQAVINNAGPTMPMMQMMPLTHKQLYQRMVCRPPQRRLLYQRRENNSHPNGGGQDHNAARKHADGSARAPREKSNCCGKGHEEEGGRRSRSVSFDEKARVVLVPTRRELLALQARLQQQHAQQNNTTGGADPPWDESIWWTRNDCRQFRSSFRKEIFAHGLEAKSLLLTDDMIFGLDKPAPGVQGSGAPISASPVVPITAKD